MCALNTLVLVVGYPLSLSKNTKKILRWHLDTEEFYHHRSEATDVTKHFPVMAGRAELTMGNSFSKVVVHNALQISNLLHNTGYEDIHRYKFNL